MDVTTIQCGTQTRDRLAEYRDNNEYDNYDQAINALINEVNS